MTNTTNTTNTNGIVSGRLSTDAYAQNFKDLHPALSNHQASTEAARCYFCYDAPCMTACPTSIDIPLFIRQIMADNPKGSARTIYGENIMGGMCARVCPTETLCEEACVRGGDEDRAIDIGRLQRFATDRYLETGEHPIKAAPSTGKKVAVVGAGPAGLSCAHRLASLGHSVTIFDSSPKSGGLNEFGIATYKATDNFAAKEVDFILSIGNIEIKHGVSLGSDQSLDTLRKDFDGVFLSLGQGGSNPLGLDGEDMDGVINAIEYISDLRQATDVSKLAVGRNVVVIGGGMTAVDMAVQMKLLGAQDVTIVYRRGQEHMNASAFEQELAQTNGVQIIHWAKPSTLTGDNNGVQSIGFERTALDSSDKLVGTDEHFTLDADMVFKAIGQVFLSTAFARSEAPELQWGQITVDENKQTSLANVWAGGDCIQGGDKLTVTAVEDGKIAAMSIDRALQSDGEN